ncbi:hypothetical protein FQN60_014018 [Etheostoma spectabile]|uniref:Uncharacterized protein n=1 Tax=Etheostoma spectabile TaxID=54343 RepID=A0A5J5D9J3_9PERO|nr:hypothetical protein FQN60_014018 [Etheostoma spectabile]
MEFAAPFGTAKKGKAAQVEEVQPMAADLSSCFLALPDPVSLGVKSAVGTYTGPLLLTTAWLPPASKALLYRDRGSSLCTEGF